MKTFTFNSSLPFSQKYLFTHRNVNVFVTCPSECFPWNMRKFDSTAQTYVRNLVQSLVIYKLLLNLIGLVCYTSDKFFLNNSWLFHACNNYIVYQKATSKTDTLCSAVYVIHWQLHLFINLPIIYLIFKFNLLVNP